MLFRSKYSKPDKPSEYIPLLCFHAIAVTVLAVSGLWWAGLLWYAGLVTTFMMSFRLRLWLEHQGTDDTQRLSLTWWQAALLSPHNAWHHWEHHKYPTVPYHRLPQARRRLGGRAILTLHDLTSALASTRHIPSGTALKVSAEPGDSLAEDREMARAA